MLKTITIENIAVIEKAEIEFNGGLNVLTGETGAGKSIVVDSINAILGERTTRELVRTGADYAFVSAYFDEVPQNVEKKIEDFGIDIEADDGLVLTRKIGANGKSQCKINGKAATVAMLKDVGQGLVNIHGQHDSQELLNPDEHYKFVDMMLKDGSVLSDYKTAFHELITVRRRLKSLVVDEDEKKRRLELLDYQVKELEAADVKAGERAELERKLQYIEKQSKILETYCGIQNLIGGDEENAGAVANLTAYSKKLSEIEFDDITAEITTGIDTAVTALNDVQDLVSDLIDFNSNNDYDKKTIEDRLDALYSLSLKYGKTEEDILAFYENAKAERNSILNNDNEIETLTAEYDRLLEKAVTLADRLSAERKAAAKQFETAVMEYLKYLDMPKITFKVQFQKGNLSSTGYDKIEFLISTNLGEPLKPLAKIASGGELSRIMLAIRSVIAHNDTVKTLIFDEIDTGVSGRASRKIGLRLASVAKDTQVIVVTHSAQIASVADEHYLVKKEFSGNRTFTSVKNLSFDERVEEIARIMGGLEITDALLKSAKELLSGKET